MLPLTHMESDSFYSLSLNPQNHSWDTQQIFSMVHIALEFEVLHPMPFNFHLLASILDRGVQDTFNWVFLNTHDDALLSEKLVQIISTLIQSHKGHTYPLQYKICLVVKSYPFVFFSRLLVLHSLPMLLLPIKPVYLTYERIRTHLSRLLGEGDDGGRY